MNRLPSFSTLSTLSFILIVFGQAGAEYGKLGKDHYLELENEAKLVLSSYWDFLFLTGLVYVFLIYFCQTFTEGYVERWRWWRNSAGL